MQVEQSLAILASSSPLPSPSIPPLINSTLATLPTPDPYHPAPKASSAPAPSPWLYHSSPQRALRSRPILVIYEIDHRSGRHFPFYRSWARAVRVTSSFGDFEDDVCRVCKEPGWLVLARAARSACRIWSNDGFEVSVEGEGVIC